MTGFPSVDVKSIGAGGGSIAWVDAGGLLHVGPKAPARARARPVMARRHRPTVTDCALVLGYIDPDIFSAAPCGSTSGGRARRSAMRLPARSAYPVEEAAAPSSTLATENMVGAIEEITVNQGIDPAAAVLVGGGGAAGFNAVAIAPAARLPRDPDPGDRRCAERRRRA